MCEYTASAWLCVCLVVCVFVRAGERMSRLTWLVYACRCIGGWVCVYLYMCMGMYVYVYMRKIYFGRRSTYTSSEPHIDLENCFRITLAHG